MIKAACLVSMVFWGLAGSASAGFGAWGGSRGASHPRHFPSIVQPANCNYADAGLHNGWGWDPYFGVSCPPLAGTGPSSGCNYDNAASHNGWGWDSVAGVSCAPLEGGERPVSNCNFDNAADNNGWGWDSVTGVSCPPA